MKNNKRIVKVFLKDWKRLHLVQAILFGIMLSVSIELKILMRMLNMGDLLSLIAAIFIIYILAKFMKPILKACVSIIVILVILAITIGMLLLLKIYGINSFLILFFLLISIVGETIALIYAIIKKISSFWG